MLDSLPLSAWYGLAAVAVILLFAVVLAFAAARQNRKLLAIINENAAASWQQQQLLEQLQVQQQKQQQQTQAEIEELRTTVIGVGQRVLSLESLLRQSQQQLEQVAEQQQSIQLFDPESKIYSRAMKMVQLGASLDEIMRECELPQAEAELLFNLHKQSQ
ncbi:DUF2802 domain-containing protein [Rheinheimera sp.]|uniref:DUF2802 domain-containing protein n=1 Tax=Rheinheimera sp. TaxID=1869214 RepID=UPI00307F7E70